MNTSRRFWIAFAFCQGLGVLGAASWSSVTVLDARWLWMMGFFLMMPGNYLASEIVDRTLWRSGLSLLTLSAGVS
jgi:hypothetical protein